MENFDIGINNDKENKRVYLWGQAIMEEEKKKSTPFQKCGRLESILRHPKNGIHWYMNLLQKKKKKNHNNLEKEKKP